MMSMSPRVSKAGSSPVRSLLQSQGALLALVAVVAFGALRYDNFIGAQNVSDVLSNSSKFALIAVGMAFVIMSGGIDLSVGTVAVLASVVAARVSEHGIAAAVGAGLAIGVAAGTLNGVLIARLRLMPFVVTLCTYIAARGAALIVSGRETVSISYEQGFDAVGQGTFMAVPIPVWIAAAVVGAGAFALRSTRFGRNVLAVGGNEEAARLMGLPVDRVKIGVYVLSGALAGLAGVILASQTSGSPTEGVGWELIAIASVVVGGTLLTGGEGSIVNTVTGVLLLAVILNLINFENGHTTGPHLTLGSHWQTIVRGLFLLAVILLQSGLATSARSRRSSG
jgi:ribose/xylose/arabinose/galactoside ABC-type transport system permease subunit